MPLNYVTLTKPLFSFLLTCLSGNLLAETAAHSAKPNLKPFQATYHIYKDGKVMAEQKTTLKKAATGEYILSDKTIGTHGLASFTGFERTETSSFTTDSNHWTVSHHKMKQKVAFSKRQFSFSNDGQNAQITGSHKKKPFVLSNNEHPIAAHMLSVRLSALACFNQKTTFTVPVLKSKKLSQYQFTATTQTNKLIKVSRKYPDNIAKKSHIWFDPTQNCLAVKTQYTDDGDLIETKIKRFNGKAVAH